MSFSFQRFLKVISEEQLITLANNSSSIEVLAKKLKLKPQQVRYLFRLINTPLKFKKVKVDFTSSYRKEDLEALCNESLQDVCSKLKLKPKKVQTLFTAFDLPVPAKAFNYIRSCSIPKEDLERLYNIENKSLGDISMIYNVSRQLVSNWLNFYGIKPRSTGSQLGTIRRKDITHKWTLNEFLTLIEKYNTQKDFLAGEKISRLQYEDYLKHHAIENPYLKSKIAITKEELRNLYIEQGLTLNAIAKLLNCHFQSITRLLRKYDLVNLKQRTGPLGKSWKKTI